MASLIGNIAILSAFLLLYLYTSELAPTSHRGMFLSLSSSSARLGSFLGPFISLLYQVTDKKVSLLVFGGATFLCTVVIKFLPDTTGEGILETPSDLQEGVRCHRVDYGTQATSRGEEES